MPKKTAGGVTTASRDAVKEWVEKNPLRAWRKAQKPPVTILESASLLGVGMSMVQMYERGAHKPGPDRAEAFAKVLGSDWSTRWDRWTKSKPTL